jgi:glycosyltransferase involved in cell wall biosynthesis
MAHCALRIAIDGRPALWPRTGMGTITRNVLEHIRGVDENCEVFAYFDADPCAILPEWDASRRAFGGPRQEFLWSNTWLPRQLMRDRIDVLVTFMDKEIPMMPTASRIVMMVHDLIPMRFPEVVFRNRMHRLHYNALIRTAVRRADLVLTNSEFSKAEIVSHLGVREKKVHKLPLGAEHWQSARSEEMEAVLARYGISRPFVLALGSTEPRKNVRRVIEAMRTLSSSHPDLRLVVAGALWREMPFAEGLLDSRVIATGHVSDDDLRVMMSAAELLAFPSLHEGFGFPVLEAMTLGVPVVTSNRTALPEVGDDAVLYADPEKVADIAMQIDRILSDRALRERLRTKGRERAKMFRWETTCAEIVDLCASLTESGEWRREAAVR